MAIKGFNYRAIYREADATPFAVVIRPYARVRHGHGSIHDTCKGLRILLHEPDPIESRRYEFV